MENICTLEVIDESHYIDPPPSIRCCYARTPCRWPAKGETKAFVIFNRFRNGQDGTRKEFNILYSSRLFRTVSQLSGGGESDTGPLFGPHSISL